ncbi:MAG: dihydroorotate dehydrogenase [Bacillota bacterium]
MKPNLAVEVAGLRMQNPVTTAAGTFGYGFEYAKYVDISRLGALTVKTITLEARNGNPPPRIAETPSGMLNAVGLENPGVDRFVADVLPCLEGLNVPIIVSIAGNTVEEYAALAEKLDAAAGISAVEVNISCPNVKAGGIAFGTVPEMAGEVIKAVKAGFSRPVIAKLTPNVTDIRSIALAAAGAGADAISLINTLLGMSIDWRSRKPLLANVFGGLSGPAVKPVALRCVWQVFEAVSIPIIGMGGICSGADALEFILAGARAVAVGTANIVNPTAVTDVLDELEGLLIQQGVQDVNELVGAAHR